MLKNKIVNKYVKTGGGSSLQGWKDEAFRKTVKNCGASWYCKSSFNTMMGKTDKKLQQYYTDGLVTQNYKGYPEWVMTFVNNNHYRDAAIGAFLHGVPKLADLLAPTINSKDKIETLWHGYAGKAYWVLFYLGAKNKMKDMLVGLSEGKDGVSHVQAMYSFSQSWKLSKANIKALENICTGTVFQDSKYSVAIPYCLRWLGQIHTKNKLAKRFIKKYLNNSFYRLEAIRSAGAIKDKSSKSVLKNFLKRAYRKRTIRRKVGRRYKSKKIDTWNSRFPAVTAAVALYGMGDRDAKKAIKYWMKYDKKTGRCDNTAIHQLFVEMLYANKKTQKKLKKQLKKLFKKLRKGQNKNERLKAVVRRASLYFLQLGDTIGLKNVIKVIKSGDRSNIIEMLQGLGGDPSQVIGTTRGYAGLGHITVGKKGLKAKVVKKLTKTIKSEFMMWNDDSIKAYGNRAWFALNARILLSKKKL